MGHVLTPFLTVVQWLYNYNWHVYPTSVPPHTAPTENPTSMHPGTWKGELLASAITWRLKKPRKIWGCCNCIPFTQDGCDTVLVAEDVKSLLVYDWDLHLFLYGDLSFFHVHTYGWTRSTRCHGDKNTGQLIWGYDDMIMQLSSLHYGPLLFLIGVLGGLGYI